MFVPFLTCDPMPLAEFEAVYPALLDSSCFHVWVVGGEVAGFCKRANEPHCVDEYVLGLLLA